MIIKGEIQVLVYAFNLSHRLKFVDKYEHEECLNWKE